MPFVIMLAATATVLMLEATRVFVAYLVFVIDQSQRVEIATIAFGAFVVIAFGGILRRLVGWRLLVGASAIGLAAARLTIQFWQVAEARLVLGGLVIVCWGWLLTTLLQSRRDDVALGVLLGLALDVAIRIGFETVDLPWMPGLTAHLATGALVMVFAVSALMVARCDNLPVGNAPALSLIAVGPGFAVFHLMTGNLGIAQTTLDTDFPTAAGVLAIGTILGLLVSGMMTTSSVAGSRSWLRSMRVEGPVSVFILAAIGALGLWLFWQAPDMTAIALIFGVAGSYVLMALALLGSEPSRWRPGGGVTLWFTAGLMLHVALLFAYYTATGPPIMIIVGWVLLLAGAFVNGTRAKAASAWQFSSLRVWFSLVMVLLVIVSGWHAITWSKPDVGDPLSGDVTVVTYNIQAGFSLDNRYDLEKTAETIASHNPDIVILQEISRGWMVLTSIDEVLWLSQRLDMPIYFGAASDDNLWGNAILTRAPVTSETVRKFTSTENFKRSVIGVAVETESGPLWAFGTHLDNPNNASEVRLEQVEQLLTFWNGRNPAIIAGDFNATPDSDVIQRLREAGFDDPGERLNDAPTSKDRRRIDFIFTTAGLDVTEVVVVERWTSDHLPVIARMTIRE